MKLRLGKKQQKKIKLWLSFSVLTPLVFLYLSLTGFFYNSLPEVVNEKVHLKILEYKYPKSVYAYSLELNEYPGQELMLSVAAKIPKSIKPGSQLDIKYYFQEGNKCLMSISSEENFLVLGPLGQCLVLKGNKR